MQLAAKITAIVFIAQTIVAGFAISISWSHHGLIRLLHLGRRANISSPFLFDCNVRTVCLISFSVLLFRIACLPTTIQADFMLSYRRSSIMYAMELDTFNSLDRWIDSSKLNWRYAICQLNISFVAHRSVNGKKKEKNKNNSSLTMLLQQTCYSNNVKQRIENFANDF